MLFIIISIILFSIIIYFMPKRMTFMEMYTTAWFALTFVLAVDTYLSIKLGLYGYFEKGIEWKTLIIHFGVFPTYNAIYLNFFPRKHRYKLVYILGHSLILVAYESATVLAGAFYYNQWNIVYSAMLYPFILLILYSNLKIIRALKKRAK
ncbi:hypothetical protein [Virgibacillus siamensis]|uniref:hypothetical protein n=1 Tax=Virgibacillus siamensis TaxID=480071 RepID=UPI0009876C10|nr:hypothetical protein [Virgibacillus siamensis]